jgi:hypothetical protein
MVAVSPISVTSLSPTCFELPEWSLQRARRPRLGGELGNDVNRDGNPDKSSGFFAVLWDTESNTVYVDANQNNTFADDKAMTDYNVRFDVGTFGSDNPATAVPRNGTIRGAGLMARTSL